MKKTILLLLFLFSTNAFSQELVGRKILNGNLLINISDFANSKSNDNRVFNMSILYGKIKSNLTYTAFGGRITLIGFGSTNSTVIGPSIEFGKFVKIFERFYYAPYIGGSIQGVFSGQDGVQIDGYASPLRFTYHFAKSFMVSANFGSSNLLFSRVGRNTIINLNSSLTNNSGIGVFYTFK
jgi:hypothetical protein